MVQGFASNYLKLSCDNLVSTMCIFFIIEVSLYMLEADSFVL